MKPYNNINKQENLFRNSIRAMIDTKHELVLLADTIDWDYFHNEFRNLFEGKTGQSPKSIRLMAGLFILKNTYDLSDKKLVSELSQNIYFQYFCGNHIFERKKMLCRTTIAKWRKKLGPDNIQIIFDKILDIAEELGIKKKGETEVIIDTTVMEKNIKYPTDAELIEKCRKNLAKKCKESGLITRDPYLKKGRNAMQNSLRYSRGNKTELLKQSIDKQKQYLKKILDIAKAATETEIIETKLIEIGNRLLLQIKDTKNKIYSVHESQAYCVSKGKKKRKYEFGSKLSVVVSLKSGLVLSSEVLVENQYDGDSLDESIEETEKNTGFVIKSIYADKGYRKKTFGKTGTEGTIKKGQTLYITGSKEAKTEKKKMRRRSLVEARISEMKRMGGASVNYLHGKIGDIINGKMCGIGENVRIILRHLASKVLLKTQAA